MNKKRIYVNWINWNLLYCVMILVLLITLSHIILVSLYIAQQRYVLLITIIPTFFLNIFIFPMYRTFFRLRPALEIYDSGIRLKDRYFRWDDIKSISFDTGRLVKRFYSGVRLPSLQYIYVLDNEGAEYSTIVDVDFYLKTNRKGNNLRRINGILHDLNKHHLLSDWAQKK